MHVTRKEESCLPSPFALQKDAGLWGALMIFCGMAGATIAGLVIDYTKWYKDVAVVSLTMAILCFIWFYEVGLRLTPRL